VNPDLDSRLRPFSPVLDDHAINSSVAAVDPKLA
jgi:hypothetical protein